MSKSKKIIFSIFTCLVLAFSFLIPIFANNNFVVYADSVDDYYEDRWVPRTYAGYTNFYGQNIWSDGNNIYFSNGNSQYVLDPVTFIWMRKEWNGFSNIVGQYVWYDGYNYYYSSNTNQYILDVSTSTWSVQSDLEGFLTASAFYIWHDMSSDLRYSQFYYSASANQYWWDNYAKDWFPMTDWTGLVSFQGNYIWNNYIDVHNFYCAGLQGSNYVYYRLDNDWDWIPCTFKLYNSSTDTYSNVDIKGNNIWSYDGKYYYSAGSAQYEYLGYNDDIDAYIWIPKVWKGYTSFNGSYVWDYGTGLYLSAGSNQYFLYGTLTPRDPLYDYYNAYGAGYNAGSSNGYNYGYDAGYNDGVSEVNNLYQGIGIFLHAKWSIVNRYDYDEVIGGFSDYFYYYPDVNSTEMSYYFDVIPGGFHLNIDNNQIVQDIDSYFVDNPDEEGVFKIDFNNPIPLSQYFVFMALDFDTTGNTITFYLDNGSTLYFDNVSYNYNSLNLSDYSNFNINSIVISFGSSWTDYSHFGLSTNSDYSVAYNNGFVDGSNSTSASSYRDGYNDGYNVGNTTGFNKGYSKGVNDAGDYTFFGLISAVFDAPLSVFYGLFDFNLMGVNLAGFIQALITLAILLFIIRFALQK